MKLIGKLLNVAILLALGIGAGYALWAPDAGSSGTRSSMGADPDADTAGQGMHAQHGIGEAPAEPTSWTCSMHPQIQLPEMGLCPLCGMDLIPVDSGGASGGLRRISVRPDQRALMRLRTVPVERRFPFVELRLAGKISYDETRLGYITAWVPGRIDDLYVDYTGVTVRKGDHMVKLYSPELYTAQQELLQALGSLGEMSRSNLASLRDSAQGTIDAAREKLRRWGLTSEQIVAIEERGTPQEHVTINSPASGLVIQREAQEGMYVETGTRIFTIAELSNVWGVLDAYEADLEWLRYGQEVTFRTTAYGGREFKGRISFIDPVLDPRTRTVKVRVNVPNPDGLLKPEMLVHATVQARVASGGRVMDRSLVGKWISPMHPEVVADGPGDCDVCGMDLVPAEELGYVTEDMLDSAAPLVIPVSAALVTGTRAIVYVELEDTEEPTYEGREIVLGPRAGDEYIVRHGLQEGDLVVAEGNFKLDSALQLRAKPSMMSPAGGGAGGGHSHGTEHGLEPSAETAPPSGVSQAARARLQVIERWRARIGVALEERSMAEVRSAFAGLGEELDGVDESLFSDSARELWRELAMGLSNDAFEGAQAADLSGAQAALGTLDGRLASLRSQLGSRPEAAPERLELTAEAHATLESVWSTYADLRGALAEDDLAAAQSAAERLGPSSRPLAPGELAGAGRRAWESWLATLATAAPALGESVDLDQARVAFAPLTIAAEEALRVLGSEQPSWVFHCPMALDGAGARWVQRSEDLRNPFFGASMLECGTTLERIAARSGHDH